MKTNLKPFNPYLYTPCKRPIQVGELGILLAHPRGYCVELVAKTKDFCYIRFLDEHNTEATVHKYKEVGIIPTGKKPQDLLDLYTITDIEFDQALDLERTMPDFTQIKKRGTKKAASKPKSKDLTEQQKDVLLLLVKERLAEIKKEEKGA